MWQSSAFSTSYATILTYGDLESELRHVRLDHRRRLRISAVDDDVPLGRGDQIRPDVARPDVIHVVWDAERFGPPVVGRERLAGERRSCRGGQQDLARDHRDA